MRISILAVGRLKRSAEGDLVSDYIARFDRMGRGMGLGPIAIHEIDESRLPNAGARVAAEAAAIDAKCPTGGHLLVLDEKGRDLTSTELAASIAGWRDSGVPELCCLVGGPDGFSNRLLEKADLNLRLGRLTWPHRLVRVMLCEQLYRAATILANHPYHREGKV
jgi:23S rRNA (pseudouridine1915-N3)-methyltransferase